MLAFTEVPRVPENSCSPSPCGPNSICQVKQGRPVCSCVPNYTGSPPFCRPECVLNQECPWDKACINEKCQDPCTNSCGSNAKCDVVNHTPFCSCLAGYVGDAFVGCSKIVIRKYLHDLKYFKLGIYFNFFFSVLEMGWNEAGCHSFFQEIWNYSISLSLLCDCRFIDMSLLWNFV